MLVKGRVMNENNERKIYVIDILIGEMERISKKEKPEPEEIALLPALVNSIVSVTGYAVIEKKNEKND